MDWFFAKDYAGAPFDLFGPAHLAALVIVLLLNVGLGVAGARFPQGWRRSFRYTLAVILLLNEAMWHGWNYATGQWTVQTMLPLHICSVFVFLNAIMLITGSYGIYEFAYLLSIPTALQALLTPDVGVYGFPHFRFFQSIISHGGIVTAAVYMTVAEGYRPVPRSLLRVALWGNVYLLAVGVLNALLGSNYLFIAHKPETPSLIDLLPSWPWYIIFIELLAWFCVLLLYLPFALKDWRARRLTCIPAREEQ